MNSLASAGKSALPGEAAATVGSPTTDAFLREQADEARRALLKSIDDLKAAVAEKVDPRQLPRRYPFITIGAVAAASFTAALVAIPSKEQQELRRLERIRRAMYPEPEASKARDDAAPASKAAAEKTPLWITLVKEGIQAARPLLVTLVTASIKAKQDAGGVPPADGGSAPR